MISCLQCVQLMLCCSNKNAFGLGIEHVSKCKHHTRSAKGHKADTARAACDTVRMCGNISYYFKGSYGKIKEDIKSLRG